MRTAMLLMMLLAGATHASYADDAETVTPTAAVATDTVAVVKTAHLSNGTQVQIRDILRADAGQHVVRAAIFDGATWWQSDVGPDVPSGDCGMGKCVDQRLVATKISRADGIVWIRYTIEFAVSHSDPETRKADRTVTFTAVEGCSLPEPHIPPSCAFVSPGGWVKSTTKISGTTVTITAKGQPIRVVQLTL